MRFGLCVLSFRERQELLEELRLYRFFCDPSHVTREQMYACVWARHRSRRECASAAQNESATQGAGQQFQQVRKKRTTQENSATDLETCDEVWAAPSLLV